jgi:hypothetical protein
MHIHEWNGTLATCGAIPSGAVPRQLEHLVCSARPANANQRTCVRPRKATDQLPTVVIAKQSPSCPSLELLWRYLPPPPPAAPPAARVRSNLASYSA